MMRAHISGARCTRRADCRAATCTIARTICLCMGKARSAVGLPVGSPAAGLPASLAAAPPRGQSTSPPPFPIRLDGSMQRRRPRKGGESLGRRDELRLRFLPLSFPVFWGLADFSSFFEFLLFLYPCLARGPPGARPRTLPSPGLRRFHSTRPVSEEAPRLAGACRRRGRCRTSPVSSRLARAVPPVSSPLTRAVPPVPVALPARPHCPAGVRMPRARLFTRRSRLAAACRSARRSFRRSSSSLLWPRG